MTEARKYRLVLTASFILLLASMVLSMSVGRYTINFGEGVRILLSKLAPIPQTWPPGAENVFFEVRLPRMLASALVGAALSLSGATFQGLFHNPLVAPDLLGVSGGASVGAASAILLGASVASVQLAALLGGLFAVFLTTSLPKLLKNSSTLMLVLAGIIVSGFMASINGMLKFVADPETQLASIVYWQMGSLATVRADAVAQVAVPILICFVVLVMLRWRINILSLGDQEATTLGVNVKRMRGVVVLLATVLTALSVCISGVVSWVGLVVPHLSRLLVGSNHTKMIPLTITFGATFMVLVDMLARSISQMEVPLSVVTGLIGAPLYFCLLIRVRMRIK